MNKLLILCLLLVSVAASGQYFSTGEDPSSIKWRQINTDNFQLIYPDYYEAEAQKLAQKLEIIYQYGGYTLQHNPQKISIILHTQTITSNGLVAYAPKRSEFFTTSDQAIFPQNWLDQLVTHEFRHVVQLDKINTKMPGILKILLGEQGTALIFGGYLPWWFIEGDAVSTETSLSRYGRGRFPSFLMEHRAQVVEKGKYSYDKAYLGSYKDYVPNYYNLGYYLVANTRARYGADVWENVLTRVGEKPFSLTPFNTALKKETGVGKVGLYHSVFDSLANVWKKEDREWISKKSTVLSPKKKTYTNYIYNYWTDKGEIISYKTSYKTTPAFVKIDQHGNEKVIFHPGTIFDESVSYWGEWIIWAESVPSLRWTHGGRSEVKLLNYITKEKRHLKPEFKAFAPSLSPGYTKVAVSESDFSDNYYLTVYSLDSGKVVNRIQTPENNYILSPVWLNSNEIIAIVLTKAGKRIAKFNLKSGKSEILLKQDLADIKGLEIKKNKLYFISSFSGKDALYFYDLKEHKTMQVYNPRFGIAHPVVSNRGEILVSDYTADGYRLLRLDNQNKIAVTDVVREKYPLAERLAGQERGVPDLSETDTLKYPSEKYGKAKHLLNFHSWAPLFVDPYNYDFRPGVSIASQNKLGTAQTLLGYKWDTSERTGKFYGRYIYRGWFPVFDFEISTGKRASHYYKITEYTNKQGEVVARDTARTRYRWNETELEGTVRFPLKLTRGKYYRLLQPAVKYKLTRYGNDSSTPDAFPDGNYQSLEYVLYYSQLLRVSEQDVWPNFGFILKGNYSHSPFGKQNVGELTAGQGFVYLPGFMANHGIRIFAGLQNKNSGDYISFSDVVRFPRGWSKCTTKELAIAGFDYKLPLITPDFSIGGLTYIRRISASFFYDIARLKRYRTINGQLNGTYTQDISSFGAEVTGDMNFLRFFAPVQLGLRTSYLKENKEFAFNLLFSIQFQ